MNLNDKAILKSKGWTVECEFPLEIRHDETGSFATGIAAEYVIDMVKVECELEDE